MQHKVKLKEKKKDKKYKQACGQDSGLEASVVECRALRVTQVVMLMVYGCNAYSGILSACAKRRIMLPREALFPGGRYNGDPQTPKVRFHGIAPFTRS